MISIQQMQYIVVLSEEQQFQRASERCFVTQPTLSMQIKKAEEQLGYLVFDRDSNPLRLTPAGISLLPILREILSETEKIKYLSDRLKGKIKEESLQKEDISFSPLAMPLLAGPGSISLLINMSIDARLWEQKAMIVLAILAVALAIFLLFTVAPRVIKYIGEAGLKSISKIMGFLVLAIGIQMITDSIIHLFKIPI